MVETPLLAEQLDGLEVEEACALAIRWKITESLSLKLIRASNAFAFHTGLPVRIISGFRTRKRQAELEAAGRPTAPDDLSTHRSCPATGADVRILEFVSDDIKLSWIFFANNEGLRTGGGSRPLPGRAFPRDWNHVDEGPRQ